MIVTNSQWFPLWTLQLRSGVTRAKVTSAWYLEYFGIFVRVINCEDVAAEFPVEGYLRGVLKQLVGFHGYIFWVEVSNRLDPEFMPRRDPTSGHCNSRSSARW